MMNSKGERCLAYFTKILEIKPIPGYDRVEYARVNGWWVIVKKDHFKVGDTCVYIEVDSLCPPVEPFLFLEKNKYRVKTQKMCKVYSQGLILGLDDFGMTEVGNLLNTISYKGKLYGITDDMTEVLGIKYYVPEDNVRKKNNPQDTQKSKIQRMMAKRPWMRKSKLVRKILNTEVGKKILLFLFGNIKVPDKSFPKHFEYVHTTDETRVEAYDPEIFLQDKSEWIQTTKVDGTSATYILERTKKGFEYYVCSRNVRQLTPDQECYHDQNVYWMIDEKYHIRDVLEQILNDQVGLQYVCLQGEIAGPSVQGNPHKLKELQFFGFNFITSSIGRWNSVHSKEYLGKYGIHWVPIINEHYVLPDTLEELKLQADGLCEVPGASGMREGYVYRSLDGQRSFKNVSREYLLKH